MIERGHAVDNANRLVGRFLQHFGLLEASVDEAISKITGLNWSVSAALCSYTPFAKKVEFVFLAEEQLGEKPDAERKKLIGATKSSIHKLNEKRVVVAHSTFVATDDGDIRFKRIVANGSLKVHDIVWTEADVEELCRAAVTAAGNLTKLAEEMVPFRHKLDFSDARNSGYAVLFF